MKTLLRLCLPSILLVAGFGAVDPATSGAVSFTKREANFSAKIKGVQTLSWKYFKSDQVPLCSTVWGKGSEKFKFKTPWRPLRALQFGSQGSVSFVRGNKLATFPAKGWVKRNGKVNHLEPTPEECVVGDGGGEPAPPPPKPDCGRKTFRNLTLLPHMSLVEGNDWLMLETHKAPKKPEFKHCPWVGYHWPTVLEWDDRNGMAGVEFPANAIFNRKYGKQIVIGRGRFVSKGTNYRAVAKVEWVLTLRRKR